MKKYCLCDGLLQTHSQKVVLSLVDWALLAMKSFGAGCGMLLIALPEHALASLPYFNFFLHITLYFSFSNLTTFAIFKKPTKVSPEVSKRLHWQTTSPPCAAMDQVRLQSNISYFPNEQPNTSSIQTESTPCHTTQPQTPAEVCKLERDASLRQLWGTWWGISSLRGPPFTKIMFSNVWAQHGAPALQIDLIFQPALPGMA